MVDDSLSIRAGEPGEIVTLVRVLLNISAIQVTGIEVSHPLVIGKENDTFAKPERAGDIALHLQQSLERAGPLGIDPDVSCRAALVSFPARRIVVIAPDNGSAFRVDGDADRMSHRIGFWFAPFRTDRINGDKPVERLSVIAGKKYFAAVRHPSHRHYW